MICQVKDNDRVQPLGSLSLPLSRLLSCPQLSLDQWFQLNHSGLASRIHINTILRVMSFLIFCTSQYINTICHKLDLKNALFCLNKLLQIMTTI